ncbi:MAG TPA: hypothetical protein VK601_12165, partial [Kofleriaceae bacterium]|nr:hypothetical protein [Kofleriaceae bacterium]
MQLATWVRIAAIAAGLAACNKPSPDVGSGSGTASGSAAGSGSAVGSPAAGSGASAGSDTAGSGASAGSATAGSGSAAGSATAATGYDKAAFLADPLCVQVADQIRACAGKPEFIAALDDGATAAQKKVNARLRKAVKQWQTSHELCSNAWDIINYEYTGFLDNPAPLKAPGALASCGALGAAVKAAGGLV